MNIHQLIPDISQAVFPHILKHVKNSTDAVMFFISIDSMDKDHSEEFRVIATSDVYIQCRKSEEAGKTLIVGRGIGGGKEGRVVELQGSSSDDTEYLVEQVARALDSGVFIGNDKKLDTNKDEG